MPAPGSPLIRAEHLVKRYGVKTAVDDITFQVRPGIVTGFLGPNGAGKSTTMRMIIGLDAPTSGVVTVNGRRYADHAAPLHEVGALLEARAVHTGRTARNHLLALAATHGISTRRVDEVIGIVGLSEVAAKRAGGFSLGMGQRLGLAAALLGDPATLILDEPVNGLDPEGIRWIRNLLKGLAAEGRTVLVSSHLMNEMAVTADHVIVVGRGRVIADVGMEQFVRSASSGTVRVRAREQAQLAEALVASGAQVDAGPDGALRVTGATAEAIGDLALAQAVAVHELVTEQASLEEAFMEMTADAVEYRGSDAAHDRSAA